ncbi:hypothetical protein ABBQ38_010712 [Trebouxia sp. C0009 RCD-2024]
MQPTREAASNPIVIILSVVCGVVLVFFLINYVLYVFAQQNKPKKAGKRVSYLPRFPNCGIFAGTAAPSASAALIVCAQQVSKKRQRREVLRGSGSATPGK